MTVVYLNVGGVYFVTRHDTLAKSDSFFSGLVEAHADADEIFIDRDPTHFRHILNWMRGSRFLPEDDSMLQELTWEADYYALLDMKDAIVRTKQRYSCGRLLSNIHAELRQR